MCTGIVDKKCDPVAICQKAVDNVSGAAGSGALRSPAVDVDLWSPDIEKVNLLLSGPLSQSGYWGGHSNERQASNFLGCRDGFGGF